MDILLINQIIENYEKEACSNIRAWRPSKKTVKLNSKINKLAS